MEFEKLKSQITEVIKEFGFKGEIFFKELRGYCLLTLKYKNKSASYLFDAANFCREKENLYQVILILLQEVDGTGDEGPMVQDNENK